MMRHICCSFWGYPRMPNGWPPSQPTNAQDPHICDAAAAEQRAQSAATTRAGCGGSAYRIDPTSEEWLASLVECLVPIPFLLLTTYRPGYRPLWIDKSYATQLALTRLTPEASRVVVQSVPQSMLLSDALRREIVGKAAGNPFFLEELTRDVVAHADRHAALVIPDTIQAVLAARMDQLPPEEKRLLQTAAVIGMDVPLPLLQAVAELPDDALNRGLAHLQTVEFLYETRRFPEREYTFKHALTHEMAYEVRLQERRRMLHVRIMTALEGLYANRLAEGASG